LSEVVVVGYAEQSRARTTSAISSVDDDALKNIPSVSPVQALQGKMAGVSVPVLSGQPGSAANIVIRGGTTLRPYGTTHGGSDVSNRDSSDPLVIIDGVFRSFTDLNPDDIESIQVMKDAASTAIYGARGANGVIVVKTKSGKGAGKANFTFRYQHGIETNAREYDYMNAREYLTLARQTMTRGIDNYNVNSYLYVTGNSATVPTFTKKGDYGVFKFTPAYIDNLVSIEGQEYVDNLLANGWETMEDPVTPGKTIIFKDSHYQDVVWNTANTNNYNLGVSGSNEAANYNISLGYVDQGGIFLGTGYERFSALANSGYKVNDKVSINLNLSYLWNNNEYSDNIERDLVRGVRVPPLNRLYNDDGTPNINEGNNPRNRLHQLYYQDNNVNTTQFILRLSADYEFLPGFHYRPSASLNTNNYSRLYFEKFYAQQTSPRDKYMRQDASNQIMTDHVLQMNKNFGDDHTVMVLGGFNYIRNRFFQVIGTSQRSATDYISTITGDPASTIINGVVSPNLSASSSFSETKSASFFAQGSYDYKNKYLLAATIRRDGFSNFAPENRFATFPSASLGWNVSNEDFWKVKFMNLLKLRTSWGESGLSNLSTSDTYGVYGASLYATGSGLTRSNIPNAKLLWETTVASDAGFDAGFFNSRLNLTVDLYNKLTRNRLADLPLAAETGFSSIKYNVGSLRNSGVEVEVDARVLDLGGFVWNSTFTFAYNNSVIVELPDNGKEKNRINGGLVFDPKQGKEVWVGGYAEGERPLGLWAWKSNGIFASDAEAAASPIKDNLVPAANLNKVKHGGDVNWADLNGDNIIDGKDMAFMGYRVPDKIGGWQNSFSYKGFVLKINMDYAMGHVISDGELGRAMGQGRSSNEGAPRMALSDKTWQKQGDVGKKYPRFSFADYDIGFRNHLRFSSLSGYSGVGLDNSYGVDNSIYYSKGDFLALREVSLAYNLPSKISKMLYMNNILLNAGVYNVGYLTAYTGLNPEVYKGYDEGGYPRPRQFTFGVTLTF
ncbi:MAG TPA: SusC/RagA family TonB-linked outer membrane protein, partial [Prolixibacteraceae bacterium]|nr:SusC/RagA family TonB-linked outer membrane protein [Prolixibacteraceae bacterium]